MYIYMYMFSSIYIYIHTYISIHTAEELRNRTPNITNRSFGRWVVWI